MRYVLAFLLGMALVIGFRGFAGAQAEEAIIIHTAFCDTVEQVETLLAYAEKAKTPGEALDQANEVFKRPLPKSSTYLPCVGLVAVVVDLGRTSLQSWAAFGKRWEVRRVRIVGVVPENSMRPVPVEPAEAFAVFESKDGNA